MKISGPLERGMNKNQNIILIKQYSSSKLIYNNLGVKKVISKHTKKELQILE